MKTLFTATLSLALIFGSHTASFAETKKNTTKSETQPTAPEATIEKTIPMNARVDEIDASTKTFTQKTKAGKVVKLVVTDKTEFKTGKFEDIKVGDTISGLRIKRNAEGTEYEIVKITKYGVAEKRASKAKNEEKSNG